MQNKTVFFLIKIIVFRDLSSNVSQDSPSFSKFCRVAHPKCEGDQTFDKPSMYHYQYTYSSFIFKLKNTQSIFKTKFFKMCLCTVSRASKMSNVVFYLNVTTQDATSNVKTQEHNVNPASLPSHCTTIDFKWKNAL